MLKAVRTKLPNTIQRFSQEFSSHNAVKRYNPLITTPFTTTIGLANSNFSSKKDGRITLRDQSLLRGPVLRIPHMSPGTMVRVWWEHRASGDNIVGHWCEPPTYSRKITTAPSTVWMFYVKSSGGPQTLIIFVTYLSIQEENHKLDSVVIVAVKLGPRALVLDTI